MSEVKIRVLSEGEMRGSSFTLTGESYKIGRTEDSDICIQDTTISGLHCTLVQLSEGLYAVKDEGSTNGTRVNGEKLEPGAEVALNSGDILQCGSVELLYENSDSVHAVTRHAGVVNLENTGTGEFQGLEMQDMNHCKGTKKGSMIRENRGHKIIFSALIGVLALGAIGAVCYMAMILFG